MVPRLALVLAGLLGCTSGAGQAEREPTGTPTDPVTVCRRAGDVCRMAHDPGSPRPAGQRPAASGSQLGVCNAVPAESRPAACAAGGDGAGPEPGCFVCMSQH